MPESYVYLQDCVTWASQPHSLSQSRSAEPSAMLSFAGLFECQLGPGTMLGGYGRERVGDRH